MPEVTDLVSADDTVILDKLEVQVLAVEALHKEMKPLGLQVSRVTTKI